MDATNHRLTHSSLSKLSQSRRLFFWFGIGSQPIQRPLYRWWDWGWCWNMITLWLETTLIGDVTESDGRSIIRCVLERTGRLQSFRFRIAGVFQLTLFFCCYSIGSFVTATTQKTSSVKCNYWWTIGNACLIDDCLCEISLTLLVWRNS